MVEDLPSPMLYREREIGLSGNTRDRQASRATSPAEPPPGMAPRMHWALPTRGLWRAKMGEKGFWRLLKPF